VESTYLLIISQWRGLKWTMTKLPSIPGELNNMALFGQKGPSQRRVTEDV
jgi:hypothetical protein